MGVDLLDFFRGKISLRRLVVLTQELPTDSRVIRELTTREYGPPAEWDQKDYMLADLIDEARKANYLLEYQLQSQSSKPSKPKTPKPAWRPQDDRPPDESAFSTTEEVQSFINQFAPGATLGGE